MAIIRAEFTGQFRRRKNIGDVVAAGDIIGQIFHGSRWQGQSATVGGQIESLAEDGVRVTFGDVISDIRAVAALAADFELAAFRTTIAGAPEKAAKKKKTARKTAKKKDVAKGKTKKAAAKKKSPAKKKTARKKQGRASKKAPPSKPE